MASPKGFFCLRLPAPRAFKRLGSMQPGSFRVSATSASCAALKACLRSLRLMDTRVVF